MATGYHKLSEKEKQTLRLLLSGYDAKSMARHLGLSVHTINERLRDARRKMATPSSREAARLLLEVERSTPEILGDKQFGDAGSEAALAGDRNPPESPSERRWAGWIAGGIAMSIMLALAALATLSGGEQAGPAEASSTRAEAAAVEAGRNWLALVDAGDWHQSYLGTGTAFQAQNTEAVWAAASEKVRTPLGAMLSRDLLSAEFAPAPPAGYYIVKFRTRFAKRGDAVETLSLAYEGGRWKVTGIAIS